MCKYSRRIDFFTYRAFSEPNFFCRTVPYRTELFAEPNQTETVKSTAKNVWFGTVRLIVKKSRCVYCIYVNLNIQKKREHFTFSDIKWYKPACNSPRKFRLPMLWELNITARALSRRSAGKSIIWFVACCASVVTFVGKLFFYLLQNLANKAKTSKYTFPLDSSHTANKKTVIEAKSDFFIFVVISC